ncbi:MAG: hypothetical protein ACFBQW_03195 [Sphingomonadaceae bacterium]
MRIIGWSLDRGERAALLERFPPRYREAVADHVTYRGPKESEGPGALAPTTGRIVGRADDGAGVEAMVVEIGGGTDRPDGSTWHITWSLGPGREAVESNDVIAEQGWETIAEGPQVTLRPADWHWPG